MALRLSLIFGTHRYRSDLPETVQKLGRLEKLFLHGNPGLGLPDEVLGPTMEEVFGLPRRSPKPPREILDYYFATRGAEGRALREVKLIVVGRGGAGKTSLIKRLKGEPFDPHEGETHGINIRELELACADGPVQARVWDFGGQHVLHAMHEFFLTARSLYLLVLGERDDMAERDAAYWLQLIRSYAGPAPVVVALNKSGGRAREMDRRTLEEKYGPILAWVPTECSEPDSEKSGIDALSAALTQATDGMEEVRRRFPAKWFEIKKWLGGMKDSYLAYEAYAARCAELGEADPAKQEELAAWLHDLGVALNYGRDPRLRDTTVLRPDWLANGIYAILRANDTRHEEPLAREGIVTLESLGPIYETAERLGMLRAKDYPEEKWPFLLRLMSLFQLSFPLDEDGQRQLVPALLPVEEPLAATEPDGAGRVRLRYEFNVVPAPLVPRLLVRTFGLIKNALHWRRGALLRYGPATAKVWTTQDERWVYATISGAEEARDDLDTMLRGTLRAPFCRIQKPERGRADGVGGRVGATRDAGRNRRDPRRRNRRSRGVGSCRGGEGMKSDGAKKARSVRLFVSYSHENAAWCKRLLPVLRVKANVDALQAWHDTELKAGDRWDKEIQAELERMDIFLCLVSYQFLASDYIQNVELPKAKARHENGEIEVVPVVLYPIDLKARLRISLSVQSAARVGQELAGFRKGWRLATTRFIPSATASRRRLRKRARVRRDKRPPLRARPCHKQFQARPSARTVAAPASQLNFRPSLASLRMPHAMVATLASTPTSPSLRWVQKMRGVQRWQDVRIWGDAVPRWFAACRVGQPTVSHHTGDIFCAFPSLSCRPSSSLRPIQSLTSSKGRSSRPADRDALI